MQLSTSLSPDAQVFTRGRRRELLSPQLGEFTEKSLLELESDPIVPGSLLDVPARVEKPRAPEVSTSQKPKAKPKRPAPEPQEPARAASDVTTRVSLIACSYQAPEVSLFDDFAFRPEKEIEMPLPKIKTPFPVRV